VVENRGGAGGTIGSALVAKAEPDGYTILVNSSAHTITPSIYPNLSYDVARDFAAVAAIGNVPNVLIIAPSKGLNTVQDFVAAAKAKPGSFNFGSVGIGSAVHLSAERFRLSAGYEAVHIQRRGRSIDRGDRRARRLLFLPDCHRVAAHSRRQVAGPRGEQPNAGIDNAGTDDDPRSGVSGFRLHFLDRCFRAQSHPAGDHRQALPGTAEGFAGTRGQGEAGCPRGRADPLTTADFDVQVKQEIARDATFAKAAGLKPN
jgi:hypothetical protein